MRIPFRTILLTAIVIVMGTLITQASEFSIPKDFVENVGQFRHGSKYRVEVNGAVVYFCDNEIETYLYKESNELESENCYYMTETGEVEYSNHKRLNYHKTSMRFLNSNQNPVVTGQDEHSYNFNYIRGNNPNRWFSGVRSFAGLRYSELYPGIDMLYYKNNGTLKYDLIVQPGADISLIRIQYDNIESIKIAENGSLQIETALGSYTEGKPYIYQNIGRSKHEVSGSYKVIGENIIGFEIYGEFNSGYPIVIDPELIYSSYFGGSAWDEATGIDLDDDAKIYVTGRTRSIDLPIENPYDSTYNGDPFDIFVAKFDSSGSTLEYCTFIGGSDEDYAKDIVVDSHGNVYITGFTNSMVDFPLVNAYDNTYNGDIWDGFVLHLNPSGMALDYSTYLGGSDWEQLESIDIDQNGIAYVTGLTQSADMPTNNAYQGFFGGGFWDSYTAVLSASGMVLQYGTYYGGTESDYAWSIRVEEVASAWVAGSTESVDFQMINGYDITPNGARDGWLGHFHPYRDPNLTLSYSTYFGGSGNDAASAVDINSDGQVVFSGLTGSPDLPAVAAYDFTFNGGTWDTYVTTFELGGASLKYCTYIGGMEDEYCLDLTTDADNHAYITGYTESFNYPAVNAYDNTLDGIQDAVVTVVSQGGDELLYSTFLGGTNNDNGNAIILNDSREAFVVGWTSSSDFPYVNPYDDTYNSGRDAFISRFGPAVSAYKYLPGDANMAAGGWQPIVIGADVTYLVNYFRGISSQCLLDGFYASADVNGDCLVIGSDVTFLVNYFRALNDIYYCPDYTPAWPPVPGMIPQDWPGCDR